MSASTSKSAYWRGLRDGGPFIIVAGPFALLFGVVGTEAGLNLYEIMGFSVLVIAGAAQFAALQLMIENAPTIIVLVTALAVNMRMAMYSASLTPHLGAAPIWQRAVVAYFNVDQSFALSVADYEARPDQSLGQKFRYFMGTATLIAPTWYTFTLAGALAGDVIPSADGLDFALPITFLAMIGPLLRAPAHILAALTSIILALLFAGLPFGSGLLVAGLGAMAVGAEVERRMT